MSDNISVAQLVAFAELCQRDPAFIETFTAGLKSSGLWDLLELPRAKTKIEAAPPPAPMIENITAAQVALFDNWPNGTFVKGTPNRYGMSIELWNLPADKIEAVKVKAMNHCFKSNVALMAKKNLLAMITHLNKPRRNEHSNVDKGYLNTLSEVANSLDKNQYVGLLNTNVKTDDAEYYRGVYYPSFQFVIVSMEDDKVSNAFLITSEDMSKKLRLAPFDSTDWQGGPLGYKIKAQSRTDVVGFAPEWAS